MQCNGKRSVASDHFSLEKTPFVAHKIDIDDKALRLGWLILAAIVFGIVIAIRIRLLGIPLERDEGEYAYAGQLILQGIPPYKLAYNMKFPGTYAAYAAIISIFGQTIAAVHLGLLFQCWSNSSLGNYLPPFLAHRRIREVLVLDNRLRASIWQPGSSQPGTGNLLLQRQGSDRGRLADLGAGWNRTGCWSVGAQNTLYHSFSARLPVFFCICAVPGILFSIALFYFRSSSCLPPCQRCDRKIVRS
jgi:hypothetical protein